MKHLCTSASSGDLWTPKALEVFLEFQSWRRPPAGWSIDFWNQNYILMPRLEGSQLPTAFAYSLAAALGRPRNSWCGHGITVAKVAMKKQGPTNWKLQAKPEPLETEVPKDFCYSTDQSHSQRKVLSTAFARTIHKPKTPTIHPKGLEIDPKENLWKFNRKWLYKQCETVTTWCRKSDPFSRCPRRLLPPRLCGRLKLPLAPPTGPHWRRSDVTTDSFSIHKLLGRWRHG